MPANVNKETTVTEVKANNSHMKIIIMVAIAMLIEGGIIGGVAMFTRAPTVKAAYVEAQTDDLDRIIEIPVLKERMSNSKQGIVYLYETEIVIQIKARYEKEVKARLEQNAAHIKMDIGTLWRQAEPRFFDEPKLSTLSRQVEDKLRDIVGEEPETGESCLKGVLIPVLRGFPANF